MGSKKVQVWLPLLLSAMMVAGMMIGYRLKFLSPAKKSSLDEVLNLVKEKYVDALPGDSINQAAITDLLSRLDPHSVYIAPPDMKEADEELAGRFAGIGIEFQLLNDTVNVVSVMTGGPSEKAGVAVGDKMIKANDSVVLAGVHITPENIRKQLRGQLGSTVSITFLHDGKQKNISITRGSIAVPSIDAAYIIAPQTGYVRINKFGEHTYPEFMVNLEKLQKQGMQKLLLDLRGNGGGFLNEAIDIADEFLDGDKLIVYTEGNHSPRKNYNAKRDGLFEKGKLAVLVDETSASASEILAGALQDWDRATIIGRRTFGKGLVQEQFQLSNGGEVRLTIARYFTPVGRNIQKPYDKGKEKYEEELWNRYHTGEVVSGDTSKSRGPSFKTPAGHVVYGGGGITPDVFVPYDTTKMAQGVSKLFYRNTLSSFVYTYFLQHRNFFQSMRSVNDLEKQFIPGEKEWQELCVYAMKDSVVLGSVTGKQKEDILKTVRALMARQLWRMEGYFEVMNAGDPVIQKCLELVK